MYLPINLQEPTDIREDANLTAKVKGKHLQNSGND